jgi:hypothetical protein
LLFYAKSDISRLQKLELADSNAGQVSIKLATDGQT